MNVHQEIVNNKLELVREDGARANSSFADEVFKEKFLDKFANLKSRSSEVVINYVATEGDQITNVWGNVCVWNLPGESR